MDKQSGDGPTIPRVWQNIISDYCDHAAIDRGLSAATVDSYRRDLSDFATYTAGHSGLLPEQLDAESIVLYLSYLKEQGRSTATVARRMSALRSLSRWMAGESILPRDVSRSLRTPPLKRPFPYALTRADPGSAGAAGSERARAARPGAAGGMLRLCAARVRADRAERA